MARRIATKLLLVIVLTYMNLICLIIVNQNHKVSLLLSQKTNAGFLTALYNYANVKLTRSYVDVNTFSLVPFYKSHEKYMKAQISYAHT